MPRTIAREDSMRPNRREVLKGISSLAATSAIGGFDPLVRASEVIDVGAGFSPPQTPMPLPRKADFEIAPGYTYISGAYTHPMPKAAAEAYFQVVQRRAILGAP